MSKAIATAIQDSGRTHREIADALGISDQAVSGWLRTGRIDKRRLPRLAQLTNKPLSWFGMGETPSGDALTPDERAILNLYAGMSPEQRATWATVGRALAQPALKSRKKSS